MSLKKVKLIFYIASICFILGVFGLYFLPFINVKSTGGDLLLDGSASGYATTFNVYFDVDSLGTIKVVQGTVLNVTVLGFFVVGLFATCFTHDKFLNHQTSKLIAFLMLIVASVLILFTKKSLSVVCDDKVYDWFVYNYSSYEAANAKKLEYLKFTEDGIKLAYGTFIVMACGIVAAGLNLASFILEKVKTKNK